MRKPESLKGPVTPSDIRSLFDLSEKVAVITGGAGLLGMQHAQAIAAAGGNPVVLDLPAALPGIHAEMISRLYGVNALGIDRDITDPQQVEDAKEMVIKKFGRVDILINNAANNPKMDLSYNSTSERLENLRLESWDADLRVGLTGALLCSRAFGIEMVSRRKGVIVNIASDLALISPDQRVYRVDDRPESDQPVKPVSYSVVKTGLLGLTRYLATYWAEAGVRVNAISLGGVYNGQPEVLVSRLRRLIPLGRMANVNEYQGAILFLCSDAASYMTGANLIIDGGRSCW